MLEAAHTVVVLLKAKYHDRLLVLGLGGGDSEDMVLSSDGVMVVRPGVSVTGVHCIELGDDLKLDEDYALFHTGDPDAFVTRFIPVLRSAVQTLGWIKVRDSLKEYLAQ